MQFGTDHLFGSALRAVIKTLKRLIRLSGYPVLGDASPISVAPKSESTFL